MLQTRRMTRCRCVQASSESHSQLSRMYSLKSPGVAGEDTHMPSLVRLWCVAVGVERNCRRFRNHRSHHSVRQVYNRSLDRESVVILDAFHGAVFPSSGAFGVAAPSRASCTGCTFAN
jgi:hypothetical protein